MRRAGRYGAYAIAALAVLLVALALLLPQLLDRPRIAAQIQTTLSAAVGGEVRWADFRLRLLPWPQGALHGLQVKTATATLMADEVTAVLRLWPLLTGNAEISSLTLARPVLRLTVLPAAAVPEEAQLAPPKSPLEAYRSTMRALADALQEFAPDTVVAIDNAGVAVHVEGMPPVEIGALALRARTDARGVDLHVTATSPYWSAMKLAGRIEYADLSSNAQLQLTRIQGKAWLDWLLRDAGVGVALPEVDLTLRFHGDAAKALELEFDGSAKTLTVTRGPQRVVASPIVLKAKVVADAADVAVHVGQVALGASGLAGGVVRFAPKGNNVSADLGYDLDLQQALGYARQFAPAPLARIESGSGALHGHLKLAPDERYGVTIEKSDAALQVKDLPGPVRLDTATVDIDPKTVRVTRAAASLPAGNVSLSMLRYQLKDGALAADGEFDLDLAKTLELVRAALPGTDLSVIESASGRARGRAKAELSGKAWLAVAEITQSDAQAQVRGLPPLALSGAAVRATPKTISIERAAVKLLDASANASARLSDYGKQLHVQGSVSEATLGPKLLAWAWKTAAIAPNFEPKAPVRVAVSHFAWGPKSPLELEANARFDAGAALAVGMSWSPQALDVRRATLKDRYSDVTLTLRTKGAVIEGEYAGTLDSRTLAGMLKSAAAPSGAVRGRLRFVADREQPRRTTVEGELKGEGLDLSWLAGKPAKIERIDLSADGTSLRIAEASVEWAGQRATLRGEGRRGPAGPVIDAQVDSPGVIIDALLPAEAQAEAKPAKATNIWPLPVSGKIAVRAGFVRYGHYDLKPLSATIVLEQNKATFEAQEALLCGFALPVTLVATPEGFSAAGMVAAQQQKLEDAARCLSDESLMLTGAMDLRLDLRTQGKPAELLQNLKGTVSADVRNGRVMKFALIGNILSMQNVVALVKEGGPKLDAEGFPFRQLFAKGRFDNGRFLLDEGVFHSNAIGLGANGWISLADYQSSLTVLVAPLALVDEAVRKLPLLGYVVGGTFTSLPVSVNGDIRDPRVVPLGPRAITSELTGLVTRTLSLPGKAIDAGK